MGDNLQAGTVLIVEDDATIAQLLERVLRDEGLETAVSVSGHDAVTLAEQVQPALVILDLMLPGMYGTSVAAALKSRWRDLPIIVVSAQPSAAVAEDAWRCGAFAYFSKPFDVEELCRVVRKALGRPPARRASVRQWTRRRSAPTGLSGLAV